MTGVSKNTVTKLLADMGRACSIYQDRAFRNLSCKRIECDEVWSFVGAKEKNTTEETKANGWGDCWTWTSIDADTKLIPCWYVGTRDAGAAYHFMHDLASRLSNRVQLTTDGHKPYLIAVADAFGSEVDYAQLVKIYGEGPKTHARYSPAQYMGTRRAVITGNPETAHTTSIIERSHLTIRMGNRRFTRLTNAFSKKVENHDSRYGRWGQHARLGVVGYRWSARPRDRSGRMNPPNEETPVPDTVAQGREKESRGLHAEVRLPAVEIQQLFFGKVTKCLSVERLDAYSGDGATPTITLARYLLNMALCESLYSPLQLCEVALRNRLHQHLTHTFGCEDWYNCEGFQMTEWASGEIQSAIDRIRKNERPVSAGRVVAELQFGFWTSLFENHYENPVRLWPTGIKFVFPYLVKSRHRRKEIKRILDEIRYLRNRVFHHERIIHWADLEAKHQAITDVIGWASPEAQQMAHALDRFTQIRTEGLGPWLTKIRQHWPDSVG